MLFSDDERGERREERGERREERGERRETEKVSESEGEVEKGSVHKAFYD
jgi:hypothetical protein